MIGRIGDWAYVDGVINIIYICKTIVHIVEALDFVGVNCLHIYCSSVSSLVACSVASTTTHGLL